VDEILEIKNIDIYKKEKSSISDFGKIDIKNWENIFKVIENKDTNKQKSIIKYILKELIILIPNISIKIKLSNLFETNKDYNINYEIGMSILKNFFSYENWNYPSKINKFFKWIFYISLKVGENVSKIVDIIKNFKTEKYYYLSFANLLYINGYLNESIEIGLLSIKDWVYNSNQKLFTIFRLIIEKGNFIINTKVMNFKKKFLKIALKRLILLILIFC
jgi:hypothetical protein